MEKCHGAAPKVDFDNSTGSTTIDTSTTSNRRCFQFARFGAQKKLRPRKGEAFEAPPVGAEHPSESSGKSNIASSGAAESAAVDAELAIVIDAWESLGPEIRSA